MRRYSILLLVLVFATASLLAVAAYNTATVTNTASLTIVNTNEALLALIPSEGLGNLDENAFVNEGGQLKFIFGQGQGGTPFGVQPNSEYTWERLFLVQNNSEETLFWEIYVSDELDGLVYLNAGGDWFNHLIGRGWLPGGVVRVSVKIDVDEGDFDALSQLIEGSITIEAYTDNRGIH